MKKVASQWLALILAVALVLPASLAVNESSPVQAVESTELEVSRTNFSLTEVRTVEIKADFGTEINPDQLEIQFGGKDLSEWKKWTSGTQYDGEPFIRVIEGPSYIEGTTEIAATIEFGLLYDRTDLSNRTIRTQYQQFIGNYELALIDTESGNRAASTVKLNVYDEFLFNDEIKPAIDEVFAQAEADGKNGRYLEYQKLGESVEGRDLHFVILARDKEAVDTYLNETLPAALEDPESLLEKLENGEMEDYQVPVWFNNIHPDEVEGVDAQVELLKKFALEDEVTFTNTDENNNEIPTTLKVDELLDDAIFLYMFTNNPDGRVANTRANAEGFDLNRDNTNQTQVETQQITQIIAEWTPLSFIDMHGYVDGFLIEPTTPPHNPNYEYDLLNDHLIEQAHSMGRAGVGNSDLTSYFIPKLEWEDGWDDMTPAYTAMYAMLHGSLGHTVEVPSLSQNSLHAMVGAGLGSALFVTQNKDELFQKQLKIFERGVNGEDNRAVDKYFVNASGESIGRNRSGNDSFFPDYYVIPSDKKVQKNSLEAANMANYLIRNGVKVEETTQPVTIDNITYPKGTYIVPMNQAKRGLANAVLYKGDNVSDWNAMYDPIVVNFPDLRGFDILEVHEGGLFEGKTSELKDVTTPSADVKGNPPKQIVANSTNDTVKLVNALLADGKTVEVVTETKGNAVKGDYIIESKDLHAYADTYYFEAKSAGNAKNIKTSKLSQPKVAASGSAQLNFSLRALGFNLVEQTEADVIVSDGGSFNSDAVAGKSYIGIGVSALNAVRNSAVLPGFNFNFTRSSHEGLVKADLKDHALTAGYEADELLYVATGSWITDVPEGADVLASFKNTNDFYVSGWWPGNEAAQGQVMAFTYEEDGTDYTLFANELAFRGHTQYSHRLLANTIFNSTSEEAVESPKGNKGNNGKKNNASVGKDKINVQKSKDSTNQSKVNVTVSKDAFAEAAKSNQQIDKITISSGVTEEENVLEVTIPSAAIEELKKAQKYASLELGSGDSVYVIPLADIDLDKVSNIGSNFTVSIEITEEAEVTTSRDPDRQEVIVHQIKVKGKSGNRTETIVDFKTFEGDLSVE
ncbi:M14 family metallopeptidase [Jeotgalibacillus proteolyticus]|uniref:X-prolyl-dipeptidyl aminopeptidase n=1 Tax=Jeotgalibacillus proteolyticus TaxID=2082395 RepID=A0A2S5G7Y9_9BACL|nr:M14 family zinc carboxypeptidase [Jeotgalibacillus proteolyticus]PPA69044.1 X-prolyl-dipeptidyl aminopeptidase [Jeotgalibacillus proteolyticus]